MGMGAKPLYQKKAWGLDRPFFAKFKKHKCVKCTGQLRLLKVTHFQIKRGSPEADGKLFRFDIFNSPIDYTFSIFECSSCGYNLSISDQFYLEKPNKRDRRLDANYYDDYHQYLQSIDRQSGTNEYHKYLQDLKICSNDY